MSIIKKKDITQTTAKTFDDVRSKLKGMKGFFLTDKTLTLTGNETYLELAEYISDLTLFPFHNAKNFTSEDTEVKYGKSIQDFTFKIRGKKYKHSVVFDYGLEFQQLVESFSGTDLYIIYYDSAWNLLLTMVNSTTFRGFKTSMINFEEPNFPTNSESMLKKVVIELKDSDELTLRGKIITLSYPPEIIDRIVAKLEANVYIDHAIIKLTYKGVDIDDINASDVTITDDVQGLISFSLFSYLGGVYNLAGFDKTPGTGCIEIVSGMYIARMRYIVVSGTLGTDLAMLEDDDFVLFEDGDFVTFEN